MIRRRRLGLRCLLLVAMVFFVGLSACGRKGPPVAPEVEESAILEVGETYVMV